MLTEERFKIILDELERAGSVEVSELMEELDASESTVRRDLAALDAQGLLVKVRGGAISAVQKYRTVDDEIAIRSRINVDAKKDIAAYARDLITADDIVYLDAGSTTDLLIDASLQREALYVTNSISHARKLAYLDCRVYLLGGEFKIATEAIVGEEAMRSLDKYNFTKGFFGTNGITIKQGVTTPEPKEALIKQQAISHTKEVYILADSAKFDQISSVTFAAIDEGIILTEQIPRNYQKFTNIKEVGNDLHGHI